MEENCKNFIIKGPVKALVGLNQNTVRIENKSNQGFATISDYFT